MAKADLVANLATCNAAHTYAHPLSHTYVRMLSQLHAAIAQEHRLLRCDGPDPRTDAHIRAAETAWTRTDAAARAVLGVADTDVRFHFGARLVRSAIAIRDAPHAARTVARLVSAARTLAQTCPATASPLFALTGMLLTRIAALEESGTPPTRGSGPVAPDIILVEPGG